MKTLTLLAAATVVLVPAVASAIPLPAKTYVMKAGASDLFEIDSSKLMMNSSDPHVVDFANMMISDHTKSTADVTAAAQADGMTPMPPMLTPTQKSMIDELKRTSGKKRDTVYEKQQLVAHKMTLAFQQEYAMSGDKPNLKATAAKIVPVVQHHIDMMQSIAPAGVKAQ